MKILITLFVLFFSSSVFAEEVEGDIYDFLKDGYKIEGVTTINNRGVLYVLNKKNKKIIQCMVTVNGIQMSCFTLDKK